MKTLASPNMQVAIIVQCLMSIPLFFDAVHETEKGWLIIRPLMRLQDNRYLENGDWQRTVYNHTLSVGTNEFDLDAETERQLEASGQAGIQNYFD